MAERREMTIRMNIGLELDRVPTRLEQDEETGQYFVVSDALNTFGGGASPDEAEANFKDAVAALVTSYMKANEPLPAELRPSHQLTAVVR